MRSQSVILKTITTELPAISIRTPKHVIAGGVLWIFWIAQNYWPLNIPAFETIRVTFTYRLATGSFLVAFIAFQWSLAYYRQTGQVGAAAHNLLWHRRLGAIAPILYFLHAPRFGYGFLALLSASFLTNAALATFGYERSLRSKYLWLTWLLTHIIAACLVVALAAIHITTAVYFEP